MNIMGKRLLSHLRALALSIRQLVTAWTGVDRIRISPTEGRLLNLDVDQSIVISGRACLITGHDVRDEDDVIRIVYQLQDADGHGTLSIHFCCRTGECTGQLRFDDQTQIVFDDDVIVRRQR